MGWGEEGEEKRKSKIRTSFHEQSKDNTYHTVNTFKLINK